MIAGLGSWRAIGPRASVSCWTVGLSLPLVPCLSICHTTVWQPPPSEKKQVRERERGKLQSSIAWSRKWHPHHIYHKLFIRSRPLALAHIQGKGIAQGHESRSGNHWEPSMKGTNHWARFLLPLRNTQSDKGGRCGSKYLQQFGKCCDRVVHKCIN